MRKIGLMVMALSIGLSGQNLKDIAPNESATKVEEIQKVKGSIINKGYNRIGNLYGTYGGKLSVTAYEFRNVKQQNAEFGLSIENEREKKYSTSSQSSYIDYEEISHLIKGIKYLQSIDKNPTKSVNFESSYKTKGGLTITLFNREANLTLAISTGNYSKETIYIKKEELQTLKTLIQDGKEKLDELKKIR